MQNWSNRSYAFRTQNGAGAAYGRPKAVLVSGSVDTLFELDMLLGGVTYDVMLVDPDDCAYCTIKHDRPNVIVACVQADDLDAFRLLSMLQFDEDTRHIPVIFYATTAESGCEDSETAGRYADSTSGYRPAHRMN